MKCYLTYFKKELEAGLQYKASALSGLTTQYFWGIIFAVIYTALYKRTTIEDINLSQLMSYLWLTQAFFALIFLSIREEGIITSKTSKVPVYVVPTNEELMIIKDTYELINE